MAREDGEIQILGSIGVGKKTNLTTSYYKRGEWHLSDDDLPSEFQGSKEKINVGTKQVHKSVFKPKRCHISAHSPTLNFTDKELRLKDHRVN